MDFQTNKNNCGSCGNACQALYECVGGQCQAGTGCDVDKDTYNTVTCGGTDCNDNDPAIHPGAPEICNGVDDNCAGGTDEGSACVCIDRDGDKFNVSMPNCGEPDCDDSKTGDPAGCPTTKIGCTEAKSKCAICINDDAAEFCDLIDNDCDGQKDEGGICSCDKLLGLGMAGDASISQPAPNSQFFAGNVIPFLSTDNGKVRAYLWDFGNGLTQPTEDTATATVYNSKGTYTVTLTAVDDGDCEDISSVIIKVVPCAADSDCYSGRLCRMGVCSEPAANTTVPLVITISSPSEGVYSQKTVPLSVQTSIPAQCSYSLNGGSYIPIQPQTTTIMGNEGLNTLTVRCADSAVSSRFTIRTEEEATLFDDMKGENQESLFDTAKEEGEDIMITKEQAEAMITEVIGTGVLEVRKSSETTSSGSMMLLNIRNMLPVTLQSTKFVVTVPKSVAGTSDGIKSPQEFMVLKRDPVLQFLLNLAPGGSTVIMMDLSKPLSTEDLEAVSTEVQQDNAAILKKQQETAKAVKITKEFQEIKKDGETYTRITTRIKPSKKLSDMALIEKIPKCLARQIDNIKIDEKYRAMIKVLNPDPLIMWQFEEMTSEEYFSYEVKGVLSEDCKKQIEAMGIADELGMDLGSRSYFSIILPLMIVPLLGGLLVHFHRFSDIMKEKEKGGAEPPKKPEKQPEKPQTKVEIDMGGGIKEFGKFLDKEIDKAEREFGKR